MTSNWGYSVRGLGNRSEDACQAASRLADRYRCAFWWAPEDNNGYRFIFSNQTVAVLFFAYLRASGFGGRIDRLWVLPQEIRVFADHCVHIWSVFEYALRLFRDSTEPERAAMESVAPRFFDDLMQVFQDFAVNSACRVTDPWIDKGHKNLVVGLFTHALQRIEPLHGALITLQKSMEEHRERIITARNKLTSHADHETIMAGKPLGAATWPEWEQFWKDLAEFVSLVHEHVLGTPFQIRASGVFGDAEMLLKKVQS